MIFPSKKDLWIVILVLTVSLLILGIGLFLLCLIVVQAAPPFALIPGLILLAVGGLLLWPVCSTYCEITSADLVVHFGPVRVRIPLDTIAEVIPKTCYTAEAAWHLGWSLDRVVIKYRKKSGKVAWIGVAVSPADKEGFLAKLAEAVAEKIPANTESDR
jgi:hypothetical protein